MRTLFDSTLVQGGYDIVDVRDVAQGILAAATKGRSGECYILSNQFYNIGDVIAKVAEFTERKNKICYVGFSLAEFFAPLVEWWSRLCHKKSLYTKYSLYTLQSNANFSHNKADRELGYTTRSIETSLKDTIKFISEQLAAQELLKKKVTSGTN